MRVLLTLVVAAALVVAGCGDDAEREAPQQRSSTELTVTVDGKSETVTDAAGVTAADLAPVPGNRACTQIFGGDATATIEGTLDGQAVDAAFELSNGCEIARWERAAALLGDPPAGGAGGFR